MRDDLGSRTEVDAATHEHAHRPDPERPSPSDLANEPQDGSSTAYDVPAGELRRMLVELQRKWAS